jgi:DNA-binding transcriptional LysR family regulator
MRLDYIKSFIGVVNYKSFSLAAKYLYLSQPTISTHIKQLEAELGVQLLVRSTKDVLLSEEGKVFYPYALQLLETENKALNQLRKNENASGGIVTIAASSVPCHYMLPQFFGYYRNQNENVSFRVMEGDSGNVLQKLLDFEVEIGIGSLNSGSEKIHSEVLFEDEIVLITPNTQKYRNMNGNFPMEQLKKERFITREIGSGTKTFTENLEMELQIDPHAVCVAAQFQSSEMVRRAVETGTGIAFISKAAAKESLDKQKLLAFSFEGVSAVRKIYLMYHKDRVLGESATEVFNRLRIFCQEKYNK